jgi:hypothetical protein
MFIEYFAQKNITSIVSSHYDIEKSYLYSNFVENKQINDLVYDYCEDCQKITYLKKYLQVQQFCINCLEKKLQTINTHELEEILHILEKPLETSNITKINELDELLKTIGRFYFKQFHERLTEDALAFLNNQTLPKDISGIIEMIIVLSSHQEDIIDINKLRFDKSIKKYNINEDDWVREVGINVNRFLNRGFLEKSINKGKIKKYKIIREKIFKQD